jgi:hypothetical protein
MTFFMNVKISLPVICYNGTIYVLVSNLMALCHKLIPVVTWNLTHSHSTGHQVSWLQEVLDCMSLTKQKHCPSQNTCPVWHKVTSGQGHETA